MGDFEYHLEPHTNAYAFQSRIEAQMQHLSAPISPSCSAPPLLSPAGLVLVVAFITFCLSLPLRADCTECICLNGNRKKTFFFEDCKPVPHSTHPVHQSPLCGFFSIRSDMERG